MGNSHSGSYSSHRPRKNVHWKSAERPSPPGRPDIAPLGWAEDGVTLRWKPPRSDGGAPLTGYQVECNRLGSAVWVRTAPPLVLRPELLLTGLEPGFQYQFRVSACNAVGVSLPGEISDILTVSIDKAPVSAPKFIGGLRDASCVENDKVEFKVYFDASPSPTVSWFKDGYEIFSSRRTAIITEGNCSTLIFHQTSLSDEGEIKCTATNRAGHAVCRTRLSLEAAPRIRLPRQYEEGLLYETDETIFLKVSVAGKPAPIVEWRHDGQLMFSSERIEIANTDKFSTLRIENASRDDRGEYQINARNKVGEDSAAFLVTITARPDPPESVTVVQNPDKSVSLSWVSPNDDGGCQVGNYVIEYYRTGWNVWLKAATSRKLTATLFDLIEGSEYRFRVKAESPYGMSEPSAETRPIFIPGKLNEISFDPMDFDIDENIQKSMKDELNIPQVVPRRKRHLSPKIDDFENEMKYTLDIPTGVTLRKHRNLDTNNSADKSNVLKESNKISSNYNTNGDKMGHGSSEFMLVLYPENERDTSEKRKSFQFDLEDAMTPPPLSLSAPELGYGFDPIRPLRHSVSSTELLHERAMSRFYQVVALKEAEKVKTKKEQTEAPVLDLHSDLKISITEEKTLNNRIKVSEENQENFLLPPEESKHDTMISNESLNRDRSEESSTNYEDDYTASTVSTGDSDFSDSDSLEADVERLRNRIEENATYHPKDMSIKTTQSQNQAVEVLTKPAPLPDPNFVPKPILKKRENDVRVSPVKDQPPQNIEDPSPSEKTTKYSEPLINKVSLFKKFAKFPLEKNILCDKKKSNKKKDKIEKKVAEIDKEQQANVKGKEEEKKEPLQDEGRSVIDYYGNIVKEYGSNKKPHTQLYTNTNDLKKAAAEQGKEKTSKYAVDTNAVKNKPVVQKKVPAKSTPKKVVKKKAEIKTQQIENNQPKPNKEHREKQNSPIETVSVSKSFSELNAQAENTVKSVINYIIDIFILCVAFWLYIFKDERLAIPFLALTMYRQVHSAVKSKMPSWITKQKPSED